tara:strand:- start:5518 stop:5694 length:177 start_codon:yes stop_codon:yes gene_type:complete
VKEETYTSKSWGQAWRMYNNMTCLGYNPKCITHDTHYEIKWRKIIENIEENIRLTVNK